MTLPNLRDIEELEFTKYDVIMIILNFIGYFVFGWERMMYVFITATLATGFIVFVMFCIKMCCCFPDSRQAVFAPYGREYYD